MPSKYWFKLYHEILDDPKMGQLSDRLYRRCIELFALAGDYDQGGLLPEIEDIAWRLRLPVDELQKDIAELQSPKLNIITQNDNGLYVTNFSKRQEPISDAQRIKSFRERKQKEKYYGNEPSNEDETHRYTDIDTESDTDKEVEEENTNINGNDGNSNSPKPNIWKLLLSYGVNRNPRVEQIVKQPFMTPEYLRAHVKALNRKGYEMPQYAGMLVVQLETGVDPGHEDGCQCEECLRAYANGKYSKHIEH